MDLVVRITKSLFTFFSVHETSDTFHTTEECIRTRIWMSFVKYNLIL